MMRSAMLLVMLSAAVGRAWGGDAAPSIDEVAGSRLELLYTNDSWRIFSITLAAGEALADHATGPRAIITLTELEIRPLAGEGEPLRVPALAAMWLTNTFSRGFTNIGEGPVRYLVIEARDRGLSAEESSPKCTAGRSLLSNSVISICVVEERSEEMSIQLDRPSWLYSADSVLPGVPEHHSPRAAGSHTLPPSDSPVIVVGFR